jgi:sugar-specific transcriptional regulator TrmB
VEKGFVSPVLGKKEAVYVPVDPSKLLELIEEKRTKLQAVLPAMQDLFENKKAAESVYI